MTPSLSEGSAQRTRVAIFIHSCILLIRNLAPRPEVYSVYTQSYMEQAWPVHMLQQKTKPRTQHSIHTMRDTKRHAPAH